MHYTTHGTICPIRGTKQWLSVLLKNTSVMAGDSNPLSADQKHLSLNSVLFTAQPRHFHNASLQLRKLMPSCVRHRGQIYNKQNRHDRRSERACCVFSPLNISEGLFSYSNCKIDLIFSYLILPKRLIQTTLHCL